MIFQVLEKKAAPGQKEAPQIAGHGFQGIKKPPPGSGGRALYTLSL
jgi:hypothetical protein